MCKLVWPGMGTMLFVCEAPAPVCEHLSGTSSASAFVNTLGRASCSRLSTAAGQREKGKSLGVCSLQMVWRGRKQPLHTPGTLLIDRAVWAAVLRKGRSN